MGAKSVSVVTALAADTEVNSYRLTIAAESACTKYSDDTSIGFSWMGVTAPSYTKSSGYASAIIGTTTVLAQVQALTITVLR